MKSVIACVVAAVLVSTMSAGSAPQDAPRQYMLYGPGTGSCGVWTAEREPMLRNLRIAWMEGFVTGVGVMVIGNTVATGTGRPLRTTDGAALVQWMDQYCRQHPLDDIVKAAAGLVASLAQ